MHVAVDMVDAKAVIAAAPRAITEFQIRIFGVSFTAYGALMPVRMSRLLPLTFCRLSEVDGPFCADRAQVMR